MSSLLKIQSNKALLAITAASFVLLTLVTLKISNLGMDVVDILARVGIVAPSWIVNVITGLGSVAAIITVIGSLGAGLPAAVLEQLAAASTAAA